MPKVPNKEKKKTNKFAPLSDDNDEEEEELEVEEKDPFPMMKKLNSGVKEERIFACDMFSKMFNDDNDEEVDKYIEGGVTKLLIGAMSDTQSMVRIAATGALRNLTSICDKASTQKLIDQDIFLPIITYFQRLKVDVKITNEEIRSQLFEHLTQLVALVSNICENCEESIGRIIETGVFETVVKYLHPSLSLPDSLLIEVGQLMQTISDCNEQVVQYLQKNQGLIQILNENLKIEQQNKYVKSLIIGTFLNIYENIPQQKYAFFQMCFPFFQKTLAVDALQGFLTMRPYITFIAQASSVDIEDKEDKEDKEETDDEKTNNNMIEQNNDNNNNNNNNNPNNIFNNITLNNNAKPEMNLQKNTNAETEEDLKVKEYTAKLEDWKSFADAQRNILEIITNFITLDEDPESSQTPLKIPPNIINLLYTQNFLSDILKKCANPIEILEFENLMELDPDLIRYTNSLFDVQQRALSCYNNILLFIPIKDIQTVQFIWEFYFNIISQSLQNENLSSPEQLCLILSGMSSILRTYQKINIKEEQLFIIFKNLELNYDFSDVVVNSLTLLGFLGQLPQFKNHLKQFGEILLRFMGNSSIPIVLESLNTVFDIFAEETVVFKQLHFMNPLQQCLHLLKQKKQNISSELNQSELDEDDDKEQILEDIDECLINLANFIEYKKNQK